MITLVDPGSVNLVSLQGALDRLGLPACRAARPEEVAPAGPILLVASGRFDGLQQVLRNRGWWLELPQLVASGRPLLALDTAMHLLLEGSEEFPRGSGLGLIPGLARRLGPGVRVPHVGWAQVFSAQAHPALPDPKGAWLHFSHSYALEPSHETLATAVHGRPFSAAEARGRVLGLQARLDKSGTLGLVVLQRILGWMGEGSDDAPPAALQ